MWIQAKMLNACSLLAFYSVALAMGTALSQSAPTPMADEPVIIGRDQVSKIMPATVFFRGQSASIQDRNSAGIRLPGGKLVLAALVDNSGYSSAIQETYQAYLITEVPLAISGKNLSPGAYGFGFVAGQIIVMDLGGNEIMRAPTNRDSSIARPTPLQILSLNGTNRIYLGKDYVELAFPAK